MACGLWLWIGEIQGGSDRLHNVGSDLGEREVERSWDLDLAYEIGRQHQEQTRFDHSRSRLDLTGTGDCARSGVEIMRSDGHEAAPGIAVGVPVPDDNLGSQAAHDGGGRPALQLGSVTQVTDPTFWQRAGKFFAATGITGQGVLTDNRGRGSAAGAGGCV